MPSPRPRTMAVSGRVDFTSLGEQPLDEMGQFAQCKTLTDLNGALYEAVQAEVDAMCALVAGADAFDVLELMRMRAIPPIPALALQGGFDGSAAAIEII